jgi:FkbM family methyltransferase
MKSFFESLFSKFLRKAEPSYHLAKQSWAQQGEDVTIDFIFKWVLNCDNPSYLDIGAHHPYHLSNTWLFYKKGCRGVNIEPDPELIKAFHQKRPGDININAGVGKESGAFDFYVMSSTTLNTFSKEEADRLIEKYNGTLSIKEVKKINVIPVNEILAQYFKGNENYFLSLDVEGWDFEILQAIDFEQYRPTVICVETNNMEEDKTVSFLKEKGYLLYASNTINCIFLVKEKFPAN